MVTLCCANTNNTPISTGEYSKLAPGKTTQIYRCGAEDLPWDSIENVDCAFTNSFRIFMGRFLCTMQCNK